MNSGYAAAARLVALTGACMISSLPSCCPLLPVALQSMPAGRGVAQAAQQGAVPGRAGGQRRQVPGLCGAGWLPPCCSHRRGLLGMETAAAGVPLAATLRGEGGLPARFAPKQLSRSTAVMSNCRLTCSPSPPPSLQA